MGDEVVGVWVRFMLLFLCVDTPCSAPANIVGDWAKLHSVSLQISSSSEHSPSQSGKKSLDWTKGCKVLLDNCGIRAVDGRRGSPSGPEGVSELLAWGI